MRTPLSAAALALVCTAGQAVPVPDAPASSTRPLATLPGTQIGPWQIGPQSTRYSSQDTDHRIDARLIHSSRYRQQFGLDAGWLLGDQWAAGLNLAAGRAGDFRDLVGNLAWTPVPGWHGRLSLGRLQSTDPYAFASGTADVRVRQNAWLAGLVREAPEAGPVGDLRWAVYGARAQVPTLAPVVVQSQVGNLLQASSDLRLLSAGRMLGADMGVGLFPWSTVRLDLALGGERTRYPMADGSQQATSRLVARAGWQQDLDACRRVGLNLASTSASTSGGLNWESGRWMLGLSRTLHAASAPDTRLSMAWRLPLGGAVGADGGSRCALAPLRGSSAVSRLQLVSQRPAQLPQVVLARVDRSLQPQALASIDTSLVAPGYGIAIVGGQLVFTLERAAQGLVEIRTLENAATVPNVGVNGQPLLQLAGDRVTIPLDNIPNPGAGQQLTYEADFASVAPVIVMRISFTVKGR
ncbi:hypothetical protein [Hydrogenophaga sp. R2]|uniref:hypothetical protein n=1 Tax=Hydrogenophaga sp. R2 TaxID=3132827 RepID=UPI003CF03815